MSVEPEQQADGKPEKGPAPYLPIAWFVLTLIVVALCVAYLKSRLFMSADQLLIVAAPLGFVLGGTIGSVGIQVRKKDASTAVRIGGPIGTGCLGVIGMGGVAAVVTFAGFLHALWIVFQAVTNMR